MASTAAHLVDQVLPAVPVRQWVLTLPHQLRYLIAHRPALTSLVLRQMISALERHLRRATGQPAGRGGSVTFIQRFGGALNLNPHFHVLGLDGLYARGADGRLRFVTAPAPTAAEVEQLTREVAQRVVRALVRDGALDSDEFAADPLCETWPSLARAVGASVQGRVAFGPRAGMRVRRRGAIDPRLLPTGQELWPNVNGFTLHASRPVAAGDREALERLCRYAARPAIAEERLTIRHDELVELELKSEWRDGTTHLVFSPLELVEKVAALVAPPHANLVRYHGVLAPGSSWRREVVPGASTTEPPARAENTAASSATDSRWIPWAELLRRVFRVDVLECPDCGGRRRVLAYITDPTVIEKILTHLGLPVAPPRVVPAAAQLQLAF